MMYRVVRHFTDLLDNNHKYTEGDVYPREGYTPSEDRIFALSTSANKQRTVLIEAIAESADTTEDVAETVAKVAAEETAEEDPADISDTNVGEIEEESDAENESEPVAEAETENEEAEEKPKKRRKREE